MNLKHRQNLICIPPKTRIHEGNNDSANLPERITKPTTSRQKSYGLFALIPKNAYICKLYKDRIRETRRAESEKEVQHQGKKGISKKEGLQPRGTPMGVGYADQGHRLENEE